MTYFIEKHAVKITIFAFFSILAAVSGAVWQAATAYAILEVHETRLDKIDKTMEKVATKEDIDTLKQDLKDYINKQ